MHGPLKLANLEEPGLVLEWKLLRASSVRCSRTWKIWDWSANVTPENRRDEPQDSWEFYVVNFIKFCAQICVCFRIRSRRCLKIDQRDEEGSVHFPTWTTRKEVYCTAHGHLKKLVFSLMESTLDKLFQSGLRKIPLQTQEGDNYVIIGYMFRAVSLPVIRISPLYIRHLYISCLYFTWNTSFQLMHNSKCTTDSSSLTFQ